MKYKKYLTIKTKYIVGVIHPQIVIEGKLKNVEGTLEAYSNNQKIDSIMNIITDRGHFVFICKLEKNNKRISIVYKDKKEEKTVFLLRNNIITRIFYKFKKIWIKGIWLPLRECYKGIKILWKEHHFIVPLVMWKRYIRRFIQKIRIAFGLEYYHPFKQKQYLKWVEKNEPKTEYQPLNYQPLISILIPVYNIKKEYLSECLDSILNQKYQNFEVCLADDCSTLQETKDTLQEYEHKDKRIKVVYRKENGHISKATNSALEIAKGEFVALMDNDDVLTENALYEMVLALNKNKDLDMVYSDEDKLDMNGKRCEPHFKPDYAPDYLLGGNYICHFEILRKKIVEQIGGFRSEFVGAQDFDLFLRFVEQTTPEKIYHIPKILYHWRKVPGSTADTIGNKDYAIENGKKAVEEALKRRGKKAKVLVPIHSTHYIVEYEYPKEPKVSIIIPTRDYAQILKPCLESIYEKTQYKNYEVIIADNDSKEEETFQLFEQYKKKYKNFKVVNCPGKFNYSKINNQAIEKASGEYLLFLNNDTKIYTKKWINSMVGYAMQKHIGAVGVKLLYPDDTIQHGGVIVGIEGTARHAFLHAGLEYPGLYGRLLVPCNYSAVTAACLMVEKKKFLEVGKLDEELAVAFNDIDLCLKLLKKDYYNIMLPQVEVYHYESKSRGLDNTPEKLNQYLKEKEYFQKRWKKEIKHDKFYNPNFSLKYDFMLDKRR